MRLLTLCLFMQGLPAAFADDEKKEKQPVIAGKYACEGEAAGGGNYKGSVEISESDGKHKVVWTVGDDTYAGVGVWNKDRLIVQWARMCGDSGLIVYKRGEDGTLKGVWTANANKLGARTWHETLTPEKK